MTLWTGNQNRIRGSSGLRVHASVAGRSFRIEKFGPALAGFNPLVPSNRAPIFCRTIEVCSESMEFRDYYQMLGVARTATADEIKKSYRRLARKYHPDVSKEKNAEQKFKEVQEAYEVLKDPEKRAAYDQLGSEWKTGQQFRPPPDWGSGFEFRGAPRGAGRGAKAGARQEEEFEQAEGYSDFFSSLFGARGFGGAGGGSPFAGGSPRRAARDHHARVDIDLEEAYAGTTRTLELKRPDLKPDGTLDVKTHAVRVTIPAGVTDGQLIRLAGQGEQSPGGGKPGDLYLEVHIRPDKLFQLEGRDVTLTLPVAPWESALGATVTVPTLGGAVEMHIPANSQSGQKLRLRGRGLPGQPAGDQYIQLKVVIPPANSPETRAVYDDMKQKMDFDPRADLER
jgi:curved DNA-binding protein